MTFDSLNKKTHKIKENEINKIIKMPKNGKYYKIVLVLDFFN